MCVCACVRACVYACVCDARLLKSNIAFAIMHHIYSSVRTAAICSPGSHCRLCVCVWVGVCVCVFWGAWQILRKLHYPKRCVCRRAVVAATSIAATAPPCIHIQRWEVWVHQTSLLLSAQPL